MPQHRALLQAFFILYTAAASRSIIGQRFGNVRTFSHTEPELTAFISFHGVSHLRSAPRFIYYRSILAAAASRKSFSPPLPLRFFF
jgi:hypothetical protein